MEAGESVGFVRCIYAIDTATGQVLAQWLPSPLGYPSNSTGFFLKLKGKLFVIYKDEFAEIKFEDILNRKNGWHALNSSPKP